MDQVFRTFKMNSRDLFLRLGICAILALMLLQLGCQPRQASITTGREGMALELWTSNQCPRPGEIVTLRATATNQSARSFLVELRDQPVLDIIIGNPDSSTLRWSANKPLTADLTRLELKPGQSKHIEMQWKVDPGESSMVVSAIFVDDARYTAVPIHPLMVLHVSNCPGPFGP